MPKPVCAECDVMIPPGEFGYEVREVHVQRNGIKTVENTTVILLCSPACMGRYGIYLLDKPDSNEEE